MIEGGGFEKSRWRISRKKNNGVGGGERCGEKLPGFSPKNQKGVRS